MVQAIMTSVAATESNPVPTVPLGMAGTVIGPCSDPTLPDAHKRILVRFDNGAEINVLFGDIRHSSTSRAEPSQE
jgi:uncharacterized protein involved in type VI secretion and phage assembly